VWVVDRSRACRCIVVALVALAVVAVVVATMKSPMMAILVALLLGAAMAFIRPAQPVQVQVPAAVAESFFTEDDLDNPFVVADPAMKNSRKCKFGDIFGSCYTVALFVAVDLTMLLLFFSLFPQAASALE
jgi:hypothetical protein